MSDNFLSDLADRLVGHLSGELARRLGAIEHRLGGIERTLLINTRMEHRMSDAFSAGIDQLKADVARQHDIATSAVVLLTGLSAKLADALGSAQSAGATADQVQALTDLHTSLSADLDSLAQAITANTPAASSTDDSGTAGDGSDASSTDASGGDAASGSEATAQDGAAVTDPTSGDGAASGDAAQAAGGTSTQG